MGEKNQILTKPPPLVTTTTIRNNQETNKTLYQFGACSWRTHGKQMKCCKRQEKEDEMKRNKCHRMWETIHSVISQKYLRKILQFGGNSKAEIIVPTRVTWNFDDHVRESYALLPWKCNHTIFLLIMGGWMQQGIIFVIPNNNPLMKIAIIK